MYSIVTSRPIDRPSFVRVLNTVPPLFENSNFQNQATYADLLGVIQGSLGLNLFVGSNQIPFQSINVSDLITSKNQVIYFPSPIVIEMKQPLRIGGSILPNSLGKGLKEQLMLKVTLICERHLKEN